MEEIDEVWHNEEWQKTRQFAHKVLEESREGNVEFVVDAFGEQFDHHFE